MSASVPLRGKHGAGRFAVVDDEDAERVLAFGWYLSIDGYPMRCRRKGETGAGTGRLISLHRFVYSAVDDGARDVDHVDGDKLDNRRANLRGATHSQNVANQKRRPWRRYKGVQQLAGRTNFHAYITAHGKRRHLGVFDDPRDAARAYNDAALIHFGEFARLNEIED